MLPFNHIKSRLHNHWNSNHPSNPTSNSSGISFPRTIHHYRFLIAFIALIEKAISLFRFRCFFLSFSRDPERFFLFSLFFNSDQLWSIFSTLIDQIRPFNRSISVYSFTLIHSFIKFIKLLYKFKLHPLGWSAAVLAQCLNARFHTSRGRSRLGARGRLRFFFGPD